MPAPRSHRHARPARAARATALRAAPALAVAVLVLATSACARGSDGTPGAPARPVVTVTMSILGDVVRQVAGDGATVEVLIPNGTDPHEFEAAPDQVAKLRDAALVVAVGLGFEANLGRTIDAARRDGTRVLEIGLQLNPIPIGGSETGARSLPAGDTAPPDPHVWMDPDRMTHAARLVADELAAIGIDRAALDRNVDAFTESVARADEQVQASLARVPDDRRALVTQHDALGYFADRYGFPILGVIVPGGSTLTEPSPSELAALVQAIEDHHVVAIFGETTESPELADTVAAEAGGIAVVALFVESLGPPGSGADTYTGLLVTNAARIADALAGPPAGTKATSPPRTGVR